MLKSIVDLNLPDRNRLDFLTMEMRRKPSKMSEWSTEEIKYVLKFHSLYISNVLVSCIVLCVSCNAKMRGCWNHLNEKWSFARLAFRSNDSWKTKTYFDGIVVFTRDYVITVRN